MKQSLVSFVLHFLYLLQRQIFYTSFTVTVNPIRQDRLSIRPDLNI